MKTLYFKIWITCGFVKVGNLRFVDGKLDDHFIMGHVRNKGNIYSEITRLREALIPYKELLGNHIPVDDQEIPLFWKGAKPI